MDVSGTWLPEASDRGELALSFLYYHSRSAFPAAVPLCVWTQEARRRHPK